MKNDFRPASEMIDLSALCFCHLNDFESFEKYLFTEEERQLPDLERFKKFVAQFTSRNQWDIYIPFESPCTMVQYQINHYVLWKTMALLKAKEKPAYYLLYNLKERTNSPLYGCFACDYTERKSKTEIGTCDCKFCPIWTMRDNGFMCEKNEDSPYIIFHVIDDKTDEETDKILKEAEIKMAEMPWSVQ